MSFGPFVFDGYVAGSGVAILAALCVLIVVLGALLGAVLHFAKNRDYVSVLGFVILSMGAHEVAPNFFPMEVDWVRHLVRATIALCVIAATTIWTRRD